MLLDRLTERAKTVLLALPKSKRTSADVVSSAKILDAIEKVSGMGTYLIQNIPGIAIQKTKQLSVTALVKEAYFQAIKLEHPYVGTEHLLLALLKLTDSRDYLRVKLELLKANIFPSAMRSLDKARKTPILDTFGENINQLTIKNADRPLIYRSSYELLVSALLLKTSLNVLIIGDDGVGKRTLVELLARNISALDVPPVLAGYQVIEFDMMAFMTNLLNKGGSVDSGLAQLADELKSLNRVILFIKNFQNIFFASAAGLTIPMFYTMFKSALDVANVRIVATMNSAIYDRIFAENEHLVSDFSVVEVSEPSEKETLKILESTALYLSDFHNITIPAETVKLVYEKAKTLDTQTKFPQKGVELLDHCCSYVILKKSKIPAGYKKLVDQSFRKLSEMDASIEAGGYDKAIRVRNELKRFDLKLLGKEEKIFNPQKKLALTIADVSEAFSSFRDDSNALLQKETRAGLAKLTALSEKIKQHIIGQDAAVEVVVKSLIRSKLGLRSKKRPLGNFLFLGPTGVGKTELAKVLASTFFGEKSLIRLDMSDFSEKHTAARLVGAPPGYVGFGEGGELTTKIETKPDSVVLFDEIEKAHPDVLNILLQIMEEGELSDAKGNTFDFSKSVVILTSNLGTEILRNSGIGFDESKVGDSNVEEMLKGNLKKTLKPELLNRFDEIIVFHRLNEEDERRILNLLVKEIEDNLKLQGMRLLVSEEVKAKLLKVGYSEEYGARGLRRTLEKEMLDKIAEYILSKSPRPTKIKVGLVKDRVVVTS
jgi:ATP-dependent Clp protease ATP-binding subunit ClpC